MLEIRLVEGTGTVDMFDGKFWTHDHGAILEFLDTRYAQSGWHNMATEFVLEYYDGVGYDGEPLKVVDVALTTEQSDSTVWLNNLTPTGGNPEPPPADATVTARMFWAYGQWSNKLVLDWTVPNPDGFKTGVPEGPLTMVVAVNRTDIANGYLYPMALECTDKDVLFVEHVSGSYSLKALVDEVVAASHVLERQVQTLAIFDHSQLGVLRVGTDDIRADNFYDRGYADTFSRLKGVMADHAQIQYYGCGVAGPAIPKPEAFQKMPPEAQKIVYASCWARYMLATIARFTNTTVFASSDTNDLGIFGDESETRIDHIIPADWCLEVGIAYNGDQVDFGTISGGVWGQDPRWWWGLGRYDIQSKFPGTDIATGGEGAGYHYPYLIS